jgi:spore coat protein U-like protein
MSRKSVFAGACVLLAAAAFASPALAATATTTMTVSATVQATCSASATPLAFGTYAGVQNDAASSLSVSCTSTTPYTISLNAGTGTGATVATRKMTSGANTLDYTLYSNSGRTTVWGQTVGTDTVAGTGNGSAQSISVYGRIAGGQLPVPATYADTITATITY